MGRLGGVSGRDMMRVAERMGWEFSRVRGDHYVFRHPDSTLNLSIPNHRELREGSARACLATMGLTVDEFLRFRRER